MTTEPLARPLLVTGWSEQNIVVETDTIARAIQRLGSTESTVLSVVDGAGELSDLVERTHAERLAQVVAGLPATVHTRVARGPTVPLVLAAVAEGEHDIVVILDDGSSAPGRLLERLVETSPVPVLLEPSTTAAFRPNVVVAVDPDDTADLNNRLSRLAAALARLQAGDVHVVHAWELAGERELLTSSTEVTAKELADVAAKVEDGHRRSLDRVLAESGLVGTSEMKVVRHLVEGTVCAAVDRVVGLNHVGLVVTGCGGRPGMDRALAGSQSLSIAASRKHATLIVPPASASAPTGG